MSDGAPRIVYPLVAPVAMMSVLWMVDGVFLTHNRLLGAILGFSGTVFGLRSIQDCSTRLTATGVTQLTWRGRVNVSWIDVTAISHEPRWVVVTGPSGRVKIPIESFSDTTDTVNYIYARLPPGLRSD